MGDKMVKISSFSVNSDFPAIAKSGNVADLSVDFLPVTVQPYSGEVYTRNITIPKGDIISPILFVDEAVIPSGWYTWGNYVGVEYYVMAIQTSATNVQVRVYIANNSNSAKTSTAFSVTVKVKAFRVP
jgi:hypothetical protein